MQVSRSNVLRASAPFGAVVRLNQKSFKVARAQKADVSGRDLLIVGPGVLGSCLGHLWKEQYPDARIVSQTNTTKHHEQLQKLGFETRTEKEANEDKFPFVVFSAPPSGSDDYPASVAQARALWDETGSMVFTSSAGLYAVEDGTCTEDSPIMEQGTSERTDRLRAAEAAVSPGGNVVRYVGLYHSSRGAHTFFLKQGKISRPGDSIVNLIHYEDAARLAMAVLSGDGSEDEFYRDQVFVGCDEHPVTYQEMIDLCLKSGVYKGEVEFEGKSKAPGKVVKTSKTKEQLGWTPKFTSFESFVMEAKGKDYYSEQMPDV